jgi:hypothetical protein
LKEYNIARYYNSKHKKYKSSVGALRREKVADLIVGLEAQQNAIRKQSIVSSCTLRASYRVGHLLAKVTNPSLGSEFV